MKIKKYIISIILIIMIIMLLTSTCFASGLFEEMKTGMGGVKTADTSANDKGIAKVINIVIGLLQVAGTGISLIVITMLGIKYLMASAGDKAEIKKQAVPIVIGCVLLFGAVNIMTAVGKFAEKALE